MKVLLATSECQGNRGDDFFHGLYGELVRLPLEPYIDHTVQLSGFGHRAGHFDGVHDLHRSRAA